MTELDEGAPRLLLGSCPDSWGVWYPDDPRQTPWSRFLDELASVGYEWLELGPYGYLPTDPAQLSDELAARNLKASGGTVAGCNWLHRPDQFGAVLDATRDVARLAGAMGAKHVIFCLAPGYRDDVTGANLEPREVDTDGWKSIIHSSNELGRIIAEEFGVTVQTHSHADSYVESQDELERFLADTDPEHVSLCLDIGHLAYGGGDAPTMLRRYPDRIGYIHIKQMDPAVLARVRAEDLSFGQAVALGVSCSPPKGIPDIEEVVDAVRSIGGQRFAIVEQDMYPCDFSAPMPIARRTRDYLRGLGIGLPPDGSANQ